MSPPLLSLRGVSKEFRLADRLVRAANDISFDVAAGECLAVVGDFDEESASGKRIVVAPDRAGTCARWRLRTRIGRKTIPADIQRGHSPCSGLG